MGDLFNFDLTKKTLRILTKNISVVGVKRGSAPLGVVMGISLVTSYGPIRFSLL